MDPFRAPRPACTRCGAPNPDHLSPTGDLVCRGCAALPAIDAQLAQGRRSGKAGSIAALVVGVVMITGTLILGVPALSGSGSGKRTAARLVGLGLALGVVVVIAAIRNLRIYRSRKS